uniref:VWFA domain-containing protein n=1 Tax=Erpetoichthys calabaricus TaxID=27687 RepID=A0A8C4TK98_ERPCA
MTHTISCPYGELCKQRDVVFLLDGSNDTRNAFPAMRDFVRRIVESLDVQENQDHVAVVQYSNDQDARVFLNTHFSMEEVLNAIRGLRHKGGRPLNTGAALRFVKDIVFSNSAGGRPADVPKILTVLSGGPSADDVQRPSAALKQKGVLSFSIRARSADDPELAALSYHADYALRVPDLSDLPSIQQELVSTLRTMHNFSNACHVHHFYGFASCSKLCLICPLLKGVQRDIVFLLDGSDDNQNGFPAVRDFVQRVVQNMEVGENNDQVAVVQFSNDPAANFYLNTHSTKDDVVNAIQSLRHKGGRPLNTGKALEFVKDNVFNPSAGSRHLRGVPQFLILLTAGRSRDNVQSGASALKGLGVVPLAIGARNADARELQSISFAPAYTSETKSKKLKTNIKRELKQRILKTAKSKSVILGVI